jgi:cell division protein FtsL
MIPWKYGLVMGAVVSLLLFHLWEQTQVIRLDACIRQLRSDIKELEIENTRLTASVISLTEWGTIQKRAEEELKMTYPSLEALTLIHAGESPEISSLAPDGPSSQPQGLRLHQP